MKWIATAIMVLAVSVAASAFYIVHSQRHYIDVYTHTCQASFYGGQSC